MAARDEVEGRVAISCQVTSAGLLADCSVLSEEPADYGFGAAALSMAFKFRMRPMTKDGVPVDGGTVLIPLRFVLPKGEPSGPPPAEIVRAAGHCYHAAAARLQEAPGDTDAQAHFLVTRLVVEMTLLAQRLAPAEIDARLGAMRANAPPPATPLQREVCDKMREAAVFPNFSRMLGEISAAQ